MWVWACLGYNESITTGAAMSDPGAAGAVLYADSLVSLSDREIRLAGYYFPTGSSKTVQLEEVERIDALAPGLWRGSYRIWGSGDLRTWFPCDGLRPQRDTIFILKRRGRMLQIGFTVEDSAGFKQVLRQLGMLGGDETAGRERPPVTVPPASRWALRLPVVVLLLLALAGVAQALYYHPLMPATVATRFDFAGEPVGWMSRNAHSWSAALFPVGLAGLFGLTGWMMRRVPSVAGFTLWLGCATLVLVVAIIHLVLRANLALPPRLAVWPMWITGGYLILVIVGAIWWMYRVGRPIAPPPSSPPAVAG
jgi:hypothetical protein